MDDTSTAFNALRVALTRDGNPFDLIGAEGTNLVSMHIHATAKESPAKTWWNLPFDHPLIARALRIDRGQSCAQYALAPFRYLKSKTGRHLILAAHPTPRQFTPIDLDWLGIETVLAWEPSTGKVAVWGDDRPQLFGRVTETDAIVFGDARAFFTAWMRQRAWYATARLEANKSPWSAKPAEIDLLPGALAIGDIEAIRWPVHAMPRHFETVGIDPTRLNRAILKHAALPMCVRQDTMRAVA